MGFFSKIGSAFKKIGSGILKGVEGFAKSPFGKILLNVGLSVLTGGVGGLLSQGLGMLGGMGGNLLGTFGNLASKFLGPAQSLLSGSGLSSVAGFLQNAGGSGDLLSMAKSLFTARQPTDDTTNQAVTSNLSQLFASQQAKQILGSFLGAD